MYMFRRTENKLGTIAENISQGLRCIGKAMQCLEEMKEEEGYGERGGYGHRDDMGYRYPVDDEEEMGMRAGYGERRGRNSMGRFTRM